MGYLRFWLSRVLHLLLQHATIMVGCPICGKEVIEANINPHIDSGCKSFVEGAPTSSSATGTPQAPLFRTPSLNAKATANEASQGGPVVIGGGPLGDRPFSPAVKQYRRPFNSANSSHSSNINNGALWNPTFSSPLNGKEPNATSPSTPDATNPETPQSRKRQRSPGPASHNGITTQSASNTREVANADQPAAKRAKPNALQNAQPLAERMRPRTLDEVQGQDLVGPNGVLRGLIESNRIPSMILWGGPGTGKTTIARVVAHVSGARFVEINSTSSGVAECKKIFTEAKGELGLTGRKTIIFCDEIHRFSKTQQDVFLGPVEAGVVTLIGATTENPSFKVQSALLSRCRVFTLAKLSVDDVIKILQKALEVEGPNYEPNALVDEELIKYLAHFADGDARTSLNLLELAMDLSKRPHATKVGIKSSLTKTFVYDRAGDQHYDTISAFHKSVRGSDPDAALYYLARMLQSGEDALFIARRMVVMASEDVGLADNTMLSLATATYVAAEKVGMPEARINLAHCAVALSLAPKSTRSYRGLSNAYTKLKGPGIAALPIPVHLRNAPTRLMKDMGFGKEYKYNPAYVDGKVKQEYLPEELQGCTFLEDRDLGLDIDEELDEVNGKG